MHLYTASELAGTRQNDRADGGGVYLWYWNSGTSQFRGSSVAACVESPPPVSYARAFSESELHGLIRVPGRYWMASLTVPRLCTGDATTGGVQHIFKSTTQAEIISTPR